MRWRLPVVAAAFAVSALAAPDLPAQDGSGGDNDQTFVIGAGFGSHTLQTPLHAGTTVQLTVNSELMQQVYVEWYVLDQFGIGARVIAFDAEATVSSSGTILGVPYDVTAEAVLDVTNFLLTAHWVPLGGRGYARMGVLAGIGRAGYEFTESVTPGPTVSVSTSGTAALLGAYLDWGADGIGGRFGAQYLATDLDPINGQPVKTSGREIYLDLRWAF